MRDENNQVRRMPRTSSDMVAEQCRHLCASAATGQRYLADIAANRATADDGRIASAHAAAARVRNCVCPA